VTNAVLGNLLGVVVTPLWFSYFVRGSTSSSGMSLIQTFVTLSKKVLLPMAVGQLLRLSPAILKATSTPQNKSRSKRTSESILLAIVWNSFSNAFVSGIPLNATEFVKLLLVTTSLHLLYFLATLKLCSANNVAAPDTTAAAFVVSHKTLAFGLPLIKTVFGEDKFLMYYCAPLMIIHPVQLFVGGVIAEMLNNNTNNNNNKM
jgi:sodium/bile acid cotransporter 7